MDKSAAIYIELVGGARRLVIPIGIEHIDGLWQIQFIPIGDDPAFYVPVQAIRKWVEA
jgi:hypothetical protein